MSKLTRRTFLTTVTAALAAPYIVPRPVLGAADAPAANNRINVGVVGFRNQGGGLITQLKNNANAQIVALCDVDSSVLSKKLPTVPGAKGYKDFREMLERKDLDAVVIATPDHTHACIAIYAMRAGKDIYCEKPMAWSIAEGRAMVKTARQFGRVLQVGSQHQSETALMQMAEIVRNGVIGKVHTVYQTINSARGGSDVPLNPQPVPPELDYDLWLGPAPYTPYDPKRTHYSWRFAREFGTGEMGNWGGHGFAQVNTVLGTEDTSPVEVKATGTRSRGIYDVWRDYKVEYHFANGVRVLLNHGQPLKAVGDKGWVMLKSAEPATILQYKAGAGDVRIRRPNGGHMGDWLWAIRNRAEPTAPVEAGHRAATMAHLANICLDLGRPLKYDPAREEFPSDDEANRLRHRPWRGPWVM